MTSRRMLLLVGLLILLGAGCEGSPPTPGASPTGAGTPRPIRICRGVLVTGGTFDPAGITLLRLDPVRCYARRSGPVPNQTQGAYMVETTFADGTKTRTFFDALVADDAGRTRHGFFEVVQPVDGAVAQVRVATSDGSRVFAEIAAADIVMA